MGFDSKRRFREDDLASFSTSKKQNTGLDKTQNLVCSSILKDLIDHRLGYVVVRIPDSREVRRPMDLSTVKSKLERDRYSTIDAFADDVRLTFKNAFWYYPLGDRQRAMANNLSQVFEAKWKEVSENRSSTLKASCASSDSCVSSITAVSSSSTKQLEEAKTRLSENLEEEKCSASSSAVTCALESAKVRRTRRQREQARKEILRVEKAARLKIEHPLQDLEELILLCKGGKQQDSHKVFRWLTLDKLGIYLKRDEFEGVDEDEFLNGDWEEGEIRC